MLRREARLRREYLYRKAREEAQRSVQEKKERVKRALEENQLIPTELRREALALQGSLEFDDAGGEGNLCSAALFHTEPTSVPTGLQVLFSHTGQFPT
uniref:IMP4, U3 small nucleolar ribonucleoprotein n=1 Tax=Mus musculus TaxID=10090 RepID=D6RCI8_MOUSE